MGEHVFRVFLKDIATVRIRCVKCDTSLDVPVQRLGNVAHSCPGCGNEFIRDVIENTRAGNKRLEALRVALDDLANMKDKFEVEFPIRLDAQTGKNAD
ncbi:MAG TPA: hypothetical protein VG826_29750 [Pirellulales bacterium]|nr:hypothetical protein [Pirellulales bacterium]